MVCGVILKADQYDDLILLPRYALKKELDSKNNSESMYQLGNLALSIQVRVIASKGNILSRKYWMSMFLAAAAELPGKATSAAADAAASATS